MLHVHFSRVSVAALLAVAALAAGSRVATGQDREASKDTKAAARQEPSTLAVSIPWQWLASSGGTMTFQCEAKRPADDDGARMIEAVTRAGRQGRYTGKGDDGGTFTGIRNGDDFTFEAVSKDGSKFAMQMPWLAAQCMFGGAKLAGRSSVELHAKEIGGRVRLEIAGQKKGVSVEVR